MKSETKVGLLFITAVVMVVIFAYYLGALNPFTNAHELRLAYNYAGGIEVGSPVRVMGIPVGKVKSIVFRPDQKMESGEEVKLEIVITVDKSAWKTIRTDSRFYINLAGVIGEKFIEVSPGSNEKSEFAPGQLVRGEDPPRIDQLISQSYGLAGKILEFVEKNEGSVIETINTMNKLVTNLNKALKQMEKVQSSGQLRNIADDWVTISDDLAFFTQSIRSEEGKKTVHLINKLIWRLDALDAKAIKKFLQEEGIKAKLF